VKGPWRSPLYAILNLPHAGGLSLVRAGRGLLNGGCGVLQLRSKSGFGAVEREELLELGRLATRRGVPLIINDDAQLAAALGEELGEGSVGLHLGQEDFADYAGTHDTEPPGCWGLSTHNLEQVGRTGRGSMTYLGFGPVFSTATKANPEPTVGLEILQSACRSSVHPVVAIGGIDAVRGTECLEAGAAAVACVSALIADSPVRIEAKCGEVLATLMMR
jgi:thiamine-phosphate pyrophosphorylase